MLVARLVYEPSTVASAPLKLTLQRISAAAEPAGGRGKPAGVIGREIAAKAAPDAYRLLYLRCLAWAAAPSCARIFRTTAPATSHVIAGHVQMTFGPPVG
jgi:hypothetical protein